MHLTQASVTVTLRIPGAWSRPEDLMEQLPDGFTLQPDRLLMPDGTPIEMTPLAPDDQFVAIFSQSCRRPPSRAEQESIEKYSVNIALSGPGGSPAEARTMMRAAAAIIQAGGAGVFIDNSGVAHGGQQWIEMTEHEGSDALSFAFVAIVGGPETVRTVGMHVLGLPDLVMKAADVSEDGSEIIESIEYLCSNGQVVGDGDVLGDEHGPRFRAQRTTEDEFGDNSPMHNRFGRLRLVSVRDIAERN